MTTSRPDAPEASAVDGSLHRAPTGYLAATGRVLQLGRPGYGLGDPRLELAGKVGQAVMAMVLGLVMLAMPLTAMAYAAQESASVMVKGPAAASAPGQAPLWRMPGSVLPTAR